jgi:Rhodopirellula transposase DDE domain
VSVGVDHDTAQFAVETLRHWWFQMGRERYPAATELLVMADAGGSNDYRNRLWKASLQQFADETGLAITVCHFPPGTSKWNKIEHRMFAHITLNWRGRPLLSREVVVNLIGSTTTQTGLQIQAALDLHRYPLKQRVSDQEFARLSLEPASFHPEWNYTLHPRPTEAPIPS